MAQRRVGGMIQVQVQGERYDAKGSFSYNLGSPMRETIVGADGIHGYKEMPQIAFIEGVVTDRQDLDLRALTTGTDITVNLQLANGKVISLRDAWFAGEGSASTEEGEINVRWEGKSAEEVV
jgi:hypothetical protein